MGNMSICAIRDSACKTGLNLFERNLEHHLLVDPLHQIMGSVPFTARDNRALRMTDSNGEFRGDIYPTSAFHTDMSGILIITTDYLLNLPGCDRMSPDISDDKVVEQLSLMTLGELPVMVAMYRNEGRLLSSSDYMAPSTMAESRLSDEVVPGADTTHFVTLDYDRIRQDSDQDKGCDGAIGELSIAYHALHEDFSTSYVPYVNSLSLKRYRSLQHVLSLSQEHVAVVHYHGLRTELITVLNRTRRTPADRLMAEYLSCKDENSAVHGRSYPLIREFFRSQGFEPKA